MSGTMKLIVFATYAIDIMVRWWVVFLNSLHFVPGIQHVNITIYYVGQFTLEFVMFSLS